MTNLPPRTRPEAASVLREWGEEGGFDIVTACRFCPLLASEGLKLIEDDDWRFLCLERLRELITALCSTPATARGLLNLINEDKAPMFALTGQAFEQMNWVLGDKP